MNEIKRNKKFKDIYTSAKHLFWQYGIKKITVEDICTRSNVSRMTFYKYFPNKIDLALLILKDLFESSVARYDKLFTSDKSFAEKLGEVINLKFEMAKELSMEMVKELYSSDIGEVRKFFQEKMALNLARMLEFIELGKNEGAINKDLPTEFIMYQIDVIFKQMQDENLYKMFKDTQELTKSVLDVFFYGIIKDKNA